MYVWLCTTKHDDFAHRAMSSFEARPTCIMPKMAKWYIYYEIVMAKAGIGT